MYTSTSMNATNSSVRRCQALFLRRRVRRRIAAFGGIGGVGIVRRLLLILQPSDLRGWSVAALVACSDAKDDRWFTARTGVEMGLKQLTRVDGTLGERATVDANERHLRRLLRLRLTRRVTVRSGVFHGEVNRVASDERRRARRRIPC